MKEPVPADYRRFEETFTTPQWSNLLTDRSLYGMQYDKNGNILAMSQKGPKIISTPPYTQGTTIDDLSYEIQPKGNRLLNVTDAVTENYGIGDFQDYDLNM